MAKLKDGFYKQTAESVGSNDFVLLAGGGSKALSDFATSDGNVTSLGTKGDYVTWTKGGTTNNLTVPYATKAANAKKLDIGNYDKSSEITFDNVFWSANSTDEDNVKGFGYAAVMNVGSDLYRGWQIWNNRNDHTLYWRPAKTDASAWDNVHALIDDYNISDYIPVVTDYYWADVPISSTSSTTTTPTFGKTTAKTYSATQNGQSLYWGPSQEYWLGSNTTVDAYLWSSNSTAALRFGTNNTERVRITKDGYIGIGTSAPENVLDVNGIQQIYQRGNDNTAFKNLLLLKLQNSTELLQQSWDTSQPSFGIGFRRYWSNGNSPYGETTHAGIYSTVSSNWRGGLVFRTKNNETQGGTHDTTALRLRPDGHAIFGNGIEINGTITSHNYHQIYNSGSYTKASANTTGAIVIQLPITSSQHDMVNIEIAVYEYNSQAASKIIVGGHPWDSKWFHYSCSIIGSYNRGVRLGIYSGKYCVILGTSSTVWQYPGVFVTHIGTVYDTHSSAYANTCTCSLVTSESSFSALVTPTNVVKATHALDAGNNNPITFHYSTGGFSSNPSWLAAWNGYDLTYVSPSVLSVNYASSAGNADTTDGLHLYTRLLGVNGTNWTFASTANSNATTHIYAPTSAGTSGLVLTSSGGTPGWTNQSSLSVGLASRLGLNGIADSTTYGTYAGIYQSSANGPESDNWHNSIKILHNNSSGYYTQLALNFTGSHGLWHRSNRAGTISRWYRVLDDQGGTLLGDLILYNGGGSGDSPALIFQRNTITDTASQLDWKIYDTVGDLHFLNNYDGWHTAFKLNYLGGANLVGAMTASRFIASGSNQYKDSGGLVMTNSDIWGLNAIYTFDLANGANEGYQFKRTNGNYDSVWAADGTFYFSPNGSPDDGYSTNYTVIHSGNIGSQSVNYSNSAGSATSAGSCTGNAKGLSSSGYGKTNLTYYQTDGSFFGNSGWTHYIIANYGDGSSLYNVTIGLPFWGIPIYKRLESGTGDGWHTFITSENISSQSVSYATSAGNADTVDSKHASDFIQTSGQIISGKHGKLSGYHQENGWHRIATIDTSNNSGYGSHILYLTGTWSHKLNTNAILHINTSHTTGKITQVSGHVGFTNKIRLVNVSSNKFYVDIHIDYTDNTTIDGDVPGTVCYYFLGNGSVTINDKVEKITDTVTAASLITLYQTEGNVFTSGNYTNWVNTTNFPGLNKTGTVTSVKVGSTSYSPSSGVVSLPAYPTSLPANGGTATKATQDGDGNTISSTYLKKSGGTMTGDITFTNKGIVVVPGNTDLYIWKVYSSTDGLYGFRLLYDGTGAGNDNSLSLFADNQDGDEVKAYSIKQDGTVSFTKTITGNISGSAAKLSTVSKTAWGQTYWTSGGVPTSISGNMTGVGSITMTGNISYAGTKNTYSMIRFIDNTTDVNGNGISIGGGGSTIIGSGESASTCESLVSGGTESMIIAGDSAITFYSNCLDGLGSAKSITMDASGYLNTSYIYYGGHEKNASSPSYVAGFNNSDNYIRSYATSSLSVNYATSAGSATNADTLDGYHWDSFVTAGAYDSHNFNSFYDGSYVGSIYATSNSPTGSAIWFNTVQIAHRNGGSDGPNYISQIAIGMTSSKNKMWFRGSRTDSWTEVVTSANINSYALPLSGGTMTGTITMNTGTGFQMKYTSKGSDPWIYANGAPTYGIRYFEGDPDKMAFSASGNNDTTSGADLCINGNGEGTVTIRGNTIIHAGNVSSYAITSRGYIGTTAVQANSATLNLTGIGSISTAANNTYDLGASGTRWKTIYAYTIYAATAFYQSSDARLKNNIQKLSKDLLDRVYNINEVSFNWKESGKEAFGYIALDYKAISKTFVDKQDDGTLTLDYTKALVAQIAALKLKIANLEERLHILERS